MNKQNELNMGEEQKRWQASENYAENKPKLAQSKLREKGMIDQYNTRKKEESTRNEKPKKNPDHDERTTDYINREK